MASHDGSQSLRSENQKLSVFSDALAVDSGLNHPDKEDIGLVEYLRLSKAIAEKGQDFKKVHMVVGSDSGDLDSVVSSLVFAFHLWKKNKKDTTAVIPVLNFPREEFVLRGDLKLVLEEQGIEQTTLLFAQDVDPVRYHQSGALVLTLVDHQQPTGIFVGCRDAVVEVIDHKLESETRNAHLEEKAKVTVEIVGSCATLIAGLLLTDPSATSSLTPLTAQLLYQTIVLDTLNFSPAGRVATPKDLLVAEQLSAMFATRLSREEVFQKLITAKSDVSNLSTEQVLRRDMKIVEVGEASRLRMAVCIIPVLAKEYFSGGKAQAEIEAFCQHSDAVAAVILGVNTQMLIARDMLLYAEQFRVLNKIVYALQTTNKVFLDLQKSGSFHALDHRFEHFQLGNSAATREVILPIITEALTSVPSTMKQPQQNNSKENEEPDRAAPDSLHFRPLSPPPYKSLNIPDGPIKSPSARSPSRELDQLKQEDFIPTETPWTADRPASARYPAHSYTESEKYGKNAEHNGYDVVDGNPLSQLAPEEDNKSLMTPTTTQSTDQTLAPSEQSPLNADLDNNENVKVGKDFSAESLSNNELNGNIFSKTLENSEKLKESSEDSHNKKFKLDLGWLSSHWDKTSPNTTDALHNPALTDTVDGLEPGASSTAKSTPTSETSGTSAKSSKVSSPTKSPSFQATSSAAWFTSSGSRPPTCTPPGLPPSTDSDEKQLDHSGGSTVKPPERFPGMSTPSQTSSPLSSTTPDSVTPWEVTSNTNEEPKSNVEVVMTLSVSESKTESTEKDSEKKGRDEVDVGPIKLNQSSSNNKPDVVSSSVSYSDLESFEKNEKGCETGLEDRPKSRLDNIVSPSVRTGQKNYPWNTPIDSTKNDEDVSQKENESTDETTSPIWDFEEKSTDVKLSDLDSEGGKTEVELDKKERDLWEKEVGKSVNGTDEVDGGRGGKSAVRQLPKTPDSGIHLANSKGKVEDIPTEIHSSDVVVSEKKGDVREGRTQNEEDLEEIHFAFRRIADRKNEAKVVEKDLVKSEEALTKLMESENMDSSTKSTSDKSKSNDGMQNEDTENTPKPSTKDLIKERTLSYDDTIYPSTAAGYHILSENNRYISKSQSPDNNNTAQAVKIAEDKMGNGDVKNPKGHDVVDGLLPSPVIKADPNTENTTTVDTTDVPQTVTAENKDKQSMNQEKLDLGSPNDKPVETEVEAPVEASQTKAEQSKIHEISEKPNSKVNEPKKNSNEKLAEIRLIQLEDQRRELFQQPRADVNTNIDNVLSKPKGFDQVDSGKPSARNGSIDADGEDSGSSTSSVSSVRKIQPTAGEMEKKEEKKLIVGEKTPLLEKRVSVSGLETGVVEKGKTNEEVYAVDMAAIEPYSQVISVHMVDNGMFQGALVCFYACYLPRRNVRKYEYLMQNIFRYFVGTLDFLEGRPCMVAYFNGAVPSGSYPTTSWLHQCYKMLDRRMEKNLQGVVIVHPNFWFKAQLQVVGRALISGGFYHKVAYAEGLDDLRSRLGLEDADFSRMKLPLPVEEYDRRWYKKEGADGISMATGRFALLRKCSF